MHFGAESCQDHFSSPDILIHVSKQEKLDKTEALSVEKWSTRCERYRG